MINIILMIGGSCRTIVSKIDENYLVCRVLLWLLAVMFSHVHQIRCRNTSFIARFHMEKRKK